MRSLYNRIAGQNLERLAALSDGVFAVAMTLLVLDLRAPAAEAIHSEPELAEALLVIAPRLVPYLMSFLTLGIFWLGQQAQLDRLAKSDRDLAWMHVGLLCVVCLVARARLIRDDTGPEIVAAICRRITIAQTLYAVGAALCVISTYWSIAFIVLIQLNYAFAPPWPVPRRRE